MAAVVCRNCGAHVLARKSSWSQTSVQWNADATVRCAERRQARAMPTPGSRGVFLMCTALSESILEAVRHGELRIVDEEEPPVVTHATSATARIEPTD